MLWLWVYSLVSVAVVSALSFVGVLTFLLGRELQRSLLLYMVSFSVGGLLGGAFFHLIPEASETSGFTPQVSTFILLGILVSFGVEECLRWRHCHVLTSDEHPHTFAYMNLFGDAVHNLIDGMVIGGSYLVSPLMGLATTLAVCFHELPQEIGDFAVLIYAGYKRRRALLYNFLSALTAFIGVILSLALSVHIVEMTKFLIPFAAGNFIYIASSDLIPELHAEGELSQTILKLAAIILGLIILSSIKSMG